MGVAVGVGVGDCPTGSVGVAVAVGVRVGLGVWVNVPVGDGDAPTGSVGVAVAVGVCVGVGGGVNVGVGVAVGVAVAVSVGVTVGVCVAVGVCVGVAVPDRVGRGRGVTMGVGVGLGVPVAVGVGVVRDGLGRAVGVALAGDVGLPPSVGVSRPPGNFVFVGSTVKEFKLIRYTFDPSTTMLRGASAPWSAPRTVTWAKAFFVTANVATNPIAIAVMFFVFMMISVLLKASLEKRGAWIGTRQAKRMGLSAASFSRTASLLSTTNIQSLRKESLRKDSRPYIKGLPCFHYALSQS